MERIRYEAVLEANFVENFDLMDGNPKQALLGFKGATDRIKDHALGHYYSSIAYKDLNQHEDSKRSLSRYFDIISESPYWLRLAKKYDLPVQKNNLKMKFTKSSDDRFLSDGVVSS